MSFQNIFTDGVLVDLNIGKWTGARSLQAEDLGIPKEKLPKTFRLGQKTLVPKEVIDNFSHLDYLARKLLTDKSFPFAFGNARFVPKKLFQEFVDELKTLQERFFNSVEDLCTNYEKYKLEVRPEYVKAAHAAFNRLSKFDTDFDESQDEFINNFLARVDSFYPTVESVRKRFSMSFVVFQVAMPDLSQAGIDDVVSEARKSQLIENTYKDALYDKVQEYVNNMVGELRDKASSVLTTLKNNIKEGKRISEASLNSVKKMVETYEKMNIVGDNNFYDKLCSFRKKYIDPHTAKGLRNSPQILQDMLIELKVLVDEADNQVGISAVADAYKNKIQL
jgi:hypothetical protein